tara:strand:- start:5661 stop:6431 length:771 start_codon:yes stop_codon:yes gene_type:complete
MALIVSWNVNSLRVRANHLIDLIRKKNPDVIMIQEIKCLSNEIPDSLNNLDYEIFVNGEKGKYGVMTMVKKKQPIKVIDINDHILMQEARILIIKVGAINYVNIYMPNGNPLENTEKFNFKIQWMERFNYLAKKFINNLEFTLIGGDFNVIENKNDAKNFTEWKNDALANELTIDRFRKLISLGYVNCVRLFKEPGKNFSFWDYQRGSWERNDGILIDHFLISPNLTRKLLNFEIDEQFRSLSKPSDHVPLILELS